MGILSIVYVLMPTIFHAINSLSNPYPNYTQTESCSEWGVACHPVATLPQQCDGVHDDIGHVQWGT